MGREEDVRGWTRISGRRDQWRVILDGADGDRSKQPDNLATRHDRGAVRERSRRSGLAERLSRDGSWSVFTGPGVPFVELARSCRNNQVRRATVEAVLAGGGSLRPSPGPPHHHDLSGLTPLQFDAILTLPERNPVSKPDRWTPV
jgi:hypothetical protein